MLSLSNSFGINDINDFHKKINNFKFKNEKIELFCEPKIDGISATLIYEKGILKKVFPEEMALREKIFLKI